MSREPSTNSTGQLTEQSNYTSSPVMSIDGTPSPVPCATAAQAKTRAAPNALLARPPPPRAAACAARTAPSRQTARRLAQHVCVADWHARACLLHVPREPQDAWLVFAELHANCCHVALLKGADAVCLSLSRSQSHVLILSSASHLPRAKSSVRRSKGSTQGSHGGVLAHQASHTGHE